MVAVWIPGQREQYKSRETSCLIARMATEGDSTTAYADYLI